MLQTDMIFHLMCALSPSAGDCWYHIPSPTKQKLKQVSVGRTSVYTVDENGKETEFVFAAYIYGYKIYTESNLCIHNDS